MELLTLEELAQYLRVTKKTIYRLIERDRIPCRKVGRLWRFDKESIDDWLVKNVKRVSANILVVDDEDDICSLFKDTIEESGHTIATVNDSHKGLDLALHNDFDLIFLDLKMPGMDGAELFRRIKETKPDVPVTIITGFQDSELMMKALKHGPLGIMIKPFSGSDIISAVNNYIHFKDQ